MDHPAAEPSLYVGIGASAGGLEAIETFFAQMSLDSGMAFIVVQHLSPDYKSLMVELLSKRTPMPVKRSENGMRVEANTVYLIPPKTELTIFHGKLLLREQKSAAGLNLPIDLFFKSLAEDQGEKAVGIVLSGTGSDGMRGVRAIKETGGVAIVQQPDTAKFDGMPKSALATGLADFVLPPGDMPEQLLLLVQQPNLNILKSQDKAPDESDLERLFSLVREKHKVDFTHYKSSTVLRRIERRMTMNQVSELPDYLDVLEHRPSERDALFRELLIGVTSFFRDPDAFQDLEERWLPELLKKTNGTEVRIWVPGCSSGEEAYSIAMLASETMEKCGRSLSVKVFATDVDQDAIARASTGVYPMSALADVPPVLQNKHFHLRNEEIQISRAVREMVVFARHNLAKDPPFTNIDFVSCRNLLIYLKPGLQRKVLEFFNFSLNQGGLLMLGSSETTGEMSDFFELLNGKWKIYRSRGKRHPLGLAAQQITDRPVSTAGFSRSWDKIDHHRRPFEEDRVLERLLNGLSGTYLPIVIVVNQQLEMLHASGNVSSYFQVQPGRMLNDVTRMAIKELGIPLATGLQRIFSEREEVRYTNIRISRETTAESVDLRILLLPQKRGQEPLAAVILETNERPVPAPTSPADQTYNVGLDAEHRITDLENELQFTKENLQATIEELETSNEELQATNEELLASNEELQSTNEELQSVNEELHTVNSEHQIRIFELTELNNDLDNLLAATDIATIFLDEKLRLRKFTPAVTRILSILDSDLGRPVETIPHRLGELELKDLSERVQRSETPISQEVASTDNRAYLLRALPYHIGPRVVSGVLISFIDISEQKQNQQQLLNRDQQLEDIAKIASIAWWELDPASQHIRLQEEAGKLLGLSSELPLKLSDLCARFVFKSAQQLSRAIESAILNGSQGQPFDLLLETAPSGRSRRLMRIIGELRAIPGLSSPRIYGVIQDVTDARMLEAELREKRTQYHELFQHLSSGVCVIHPREEGATYDLEDINQSGTTLLQLGDAVSSVNNLKQLLPGIEASGLLSAITKVYRSGDALQFPVYHYQDDTRDLWLECSIYSLPSSRIVWIFDDVTDRINRDAS